MRRGSLYEAAGGAPAFRRLATAHHARCLEGPVLNHPFSTTCGGQSATLPAVSPERVRVPDGLPIPHWTWNRRLLP